MSKAPDTDTSLEDTRLLLLKQIADRLQTLIWIGVVAVFLLGYIAFT